MLEIRESCSTYEQTKARAEYARLFSLQILLFSGAQNTLRWRSKCLRWDWNQNQFAGIAKGMKGMENRFEDMTVDMRAADFQAQQGQQQRANITARFTRSRLEASGSCWFSTIVSKPRFYTSATNSCGYSNKKDKTNASSSRRL